MATRAKFEGYEECRLNQFTFVKYNRSPCLFVLLKKRNLKLFNVIYFIIESFILLLNKCCKTKDLIKKKKKKEKEKRKKKKEERISEREEESGRIKMFFSAFARNPIKPV